MSLPRVPILMYHEVAPVAPRGFEKYVVTPAMFAAQMRWLALAGYTPIAPDALVAARRGGRALPSRPVVITFDDGFAACARHVAPVLAMHGFTAVFFVVSGLVGEPSRWLLAERGIELPLADWRALRALHDAGIACGSHTVSHPRLTALPSAAVREELCDSRQRLEDALGVAVTDLAYPFGVWDERVAAIAAECGYATACTVTIALSTEGDAPLALPRVPVTGHDSLLDFACRLRTAHGARDRLRAAVRRMLRRSPAAAAAS